MSNESTEKEQKIVTKKHVARMEKEQKQRKILLISIFSILAVIVLLIIYGVLSKTVFISGPLAANRTVAVVNGEKINVEQFQKRVRFERFSLEQTFMNYQTSFYASYFQSQLLQVQNQLDDYVTYGGTILDTMISEKILEQKAAELGLTVTEDEISKMIEENFGYYANGTPTPEATLEYRPTSTFSPTQLAIITLTPTPTEMPVELPTPTEMAATVAPETDEEDAATLTVEPTEVVPTNTPTIEPTATEVEPTPTEFTRDGFNILYGTVVADLSTTTQFEDADFRNYVRGILLRQKLYDLWTKDVAIDQDMVWARHILVASEEDAQIVLDKLNAGEDFASLAAYYSQDTSNSSNGGDLGWMYKGQMVQEFEEAAWALEPGQISQPVKTSFGVHIIQAISHETRQLSAAELSSAKSTAYQMMVDEVTKASTTKKFNLWASVVPSDPSIPEEYRIVQ